MVSKNTIMSRRRTFYQLSPPLTLHENPPRALTRDANTNGPIGEVHKKCFALSPDALSKIVAEMRKVGDQILALEQRKAAALAAPQPMPQPSPAPTHDAPFRLFLSKRTKDQSIMRNPSLAPNNHLTFHPHTIKPATTRDTVYGETPSRFTSAEADRMARHIVGAGMPTAAELNAANAAYHAGHGASGQSRDNAVAPGGEGGQSGVNRRGGMLEAYPSDLSEGFANALNQIPSGQPQTALNAYHAAYHKARTPAARDAVDKIWSAFQRR